MEIATLGNSITEFEELVRKRIRAKLRWDRGMLQAVEVIPYLPKSDAEWDLMQTHGDFLEVKGFLSLDSSEEGRMFHLHVPAGLNEQEDMKVANAIAETCVTAIKQMKKAKREATSARLG
jgi:hypothetical protein